VPRLTRPAPSIEPMRTLAGAMPRMSSAPALLPATPASKMTRAAPPLALPWRNIFPPKASALAPPRTMKVAFAAVELSTKPTKLPPKPTTPPDPKVPMPPSTMNVALAALALSWKEMNPESATGPVAPRAMSVALAAVELPTKRTVPPRPNSEPPPSAMIVAVAAEADSANRVRPPSPPAGLAERLRMKALPASAVFPKTTAPLWRRPLRPPR